MALNIWVNLWSKLNPLGNMFSSKPTTPTPPPAPIANTAMGQDYVEELKKTGKDLEEKATALDEPKTILWPTSFDWSTASVNQFKGGLQASQPTGGGMVPPTPSSQPLQANKQEPIPTVMPEEEGGFLSSLIPKASAEKQLSDEEIKTLIDEWYSDEEIAKADEQLKTTPESEVITEEVPQEKSLWQKYQDKFNEISDMVGAPIITLWEKGLGKLVNNLITQAEGDEVPESEQFKARDVAELGNATIGTAFTVVAPLVTLALNTASATPYVRGIPEGISWLMKKGGGLINKLPGLSSFREWLPTKEDKEAFDSFVWTVATIWTTEAIGKYKGKTTKEIIEWYNSLPWRAIEAVRTSPKTIPKAIETKYVKSEMETLSAPVRENIPWFKKATDIYREAEKKWIKLEEEAVNSGVRSQHIIEDGRYNTLDTASNLRSDAGKASSELLLPALRVADKTVPKVSIEALERQVMDNIANNKTVSPASREAQLTAAKKQFEWYKKEYPEGLSLEDSHLQKIVMAKEARFNELGSVADNNTAQANAKIADVLRKDVETRSPADLPVREVNAEFSKQYKVADYLEALNTKKAPQTIVEKLSKRGLEISWAAVWQWVTGSLLWGLAGYHTGAVLFNMVNNMKSPIRAKFLENLKESNPEAFTAIEKYLVKEKVTPTPQLSLPPRWGTYMEPIKWTSPGVLEKTSAAISWKVGERPNPLGWLKK